MKELTLQEIHEGTLSVVEEIDRICNKIGINYYVGFGSLIGAVRHKGFIPWDDDFDIIMLRPEHDKFVRYCAKHEKEMFPYRLIGRFNEKNYPYNICRFSDIRYLMITEDGKESLDGMFVDIYPFDGVGNNLVEAKKKFLPVRLKNRTIK